MAGGRKRSIEGMVRQVNFESGAGMDINRVSSSEFEFELCRVMPTLYQITVC